jgi:hypothetical protein
MYQNLTNKAKETKIKKVLHLVSKAYEHDSFVNEDEKMVHKLSMNLHPNQWLHVGDNNFNNFINLNIEQRHINSKPKGIWASKGDWFFDKDKYLILLEIDYSKILVLTTKEDLLEFEKHYCKQILYKPRTKHYTRITKHTNSYKNSIKKNNSITKKRKTQNKQLHCSMNINWRKVQKNYNGIAIVPNPDWYFPIENSKFKNSKYNIDFEIKSHLWLRTYDVSSLVIWKNTDNTITKHYEIGKISNIIKLAKEQKEKLENLILHKIKNI